MTAQSEFLRYSVVKLRQECARIESCIAKLTPEQVWHRAGESQNAVGNLLLHLTGNLREWILNGLTDAGIHRDRDAEFSTRNGPTPDVLLRDLSAALDHACTVIEQLPPERLTLTVHIQSHEVTRLEAIYHVVEHFSGHTYQVILMTKAFTSNA